MLWHVLVSLIWFMIFFGNANVQCRTRNDHLNLAKVSDFDDIIEYAKQQHFSSTTAVAKKHVTYSSSTISPTRSKRQTIKHDIAQTTRKPSDEEYVLGLGKQNGCDTLLSKILEYNTLKRKLRKLTATLKQRCSDQNFNDFINSLINTCLYNVADSDKNQSRQVSITPTSESSTVQIADTSTRIIQNSVAPNPIKSVHRRLKPCEDKKPGEQCCLTFVEDPLSNDVRLESIPCESLADVNGDLSGVAPLDKLQMGDNYLTANLQIPNFLKKRYLKNIRDNQYKPDADGVYGVFIPVRDDEIPNVSSNSLESRLKKRSLVPFHAGRKPLSKTKKLRHPDMKVSEPKKRSSCTDQELTYLGQAKSILDELTKMKKYFVNKNLKKSEDTLKKNDEDEEQTQSQKCISEERVLQMHQEILHKINELGHTIEDYKNCVSQSKPEITTEEELPTTEGNVVVYLLPKKGLTKFHTVSPMWVADYNEAMNYREKRRPDADFDYPYEEYYNEYNFNVVATTTVNPEIKPETRNDRSNSSNPVKTETECTSKKVNGTRCHGFGENATSSNVSTASNNLEAPVEIKELNLWNSPNLNTTAHSVNPVTILHENETAATLKDSFLNNKFNISSLLYGVSPESDSEPPNEAARFPVSVPVAGLGERFFFTVDIGATKKPFTFIPELLGGNETVTVASTVQKKSKVKKSYIRRLERDLKVADEIENILQKIKREDSDFETETFKRRRKNAGVFRAMDEEPSRFYDPNKREFKKHKSKKKKIWKKLFEYPNSEFGTVTMGSNHSLGTTDLDTGFKHLFTIYNAFDEGATNDVSEHLTDDMDRNTAVTAHSNLIRNANPRKQSNSTQASGNTTTEHTTAPSNITTTHSVKHITLSNAPIELPFDTTTKRVKTTTKREHHNKTSTTEAVTEITIIVTDEDYYDVVVNVTSTVTETRTTDENTKSHLESTTPASKSTVLHVDLYLTSTVPTTENGTLQSDEFGELQTINLENVNVTEEVSTIIRLDEDVAGDVTMESSSTTDEPNWALPKYTEDHLESELMDAKLLFATLTPQMVVVTTINENDNIFILKSNYTIIENEFNNQKNKTRTTLPPVTETDKYLETLYEPTNTVPKLHKTRKIKTKKPHEKFLINETMPLLFSSKSSSTTKSGFLNKILQRTTSKAPKRNASEFPLLSATEELGMGNKSLLLLDQEDLNYQTSKNRPKTSPTTDTTSDSSKNDLINRQVVLTTSNGVSTEPWDYEETNIPKNGAFLFGGNTNDIDFSFLHTKPSGKEITEPNLFLDFVLHDFTTQSSLNPTESTPLKKSEDSFTTLKSKRNKLPKTETVQSKAAALRRTLNHKIQNGEEPADYSFMYDEGTVEDTFKSTSICNETDTGDITVPVSTEPDDLNFLNSTKDNSEITEENIFLNLVLHDLTTKEPNLTLDFIHDETTPNSVLPEVHHFEEPSSEISATDFSFLHTTKNLSEMTEENLFLNLVLHDLTTESPKPILEETQNSHFHPDEQVENLESLLPTISDTHDDTHDDVKKHLQKIIETKLLLNLLSHNLHNKAGYPIQDLIENEKLKHLMEKVLHKNKHFLDTMPNSNDFTSLNLKNEIRREKTQKVDLSKPKKKRTEDFLVTNVTPIELLFPILKFVKKSNKISSTSSGTTTRSTTPVTTADSVGSHNHTEITHTTIDKSSVSSGKNTTLDTILNTTHSNEEVTEKNLFFKAILHNSTEESVNYTGATPILKELNTSTESSIKDNTLDTNLSFLNTTHSHEEITEKSWFFKAILDNSTEENVNYTNATPILKEFNTYTESSVKDTTLDTILNFNTTHSHEEITEKSWFFKAILDNSTEESMNYADSMPILKEVNSSTVWSVKDTTLDTIFSFLNTTHGNEEITEENLFFKAILHNSTEESVENAKINPTQSNVTEKEVGLTTNFTFDTPLDLSFLNTTHGNEEITEESIFLNLVLQDLTTKTDDPMITDDYEVDDTTKNKEELTVDCQTTQEPETESSETDTVSCQKTTTCETAKSKKKKSKWRSMLHHFKDTLNNLFTESSILGLGVQKKETSLRDIPEKLNALLQKLKDAAQYNFDDDNVEQNDELNLAAQTEPIKYEDEREVSKNSIKEITPSTFSYRQDKVRKAVGLIDNNAQHPTHPHENFSTLKNTQNDSDSHKELDFSFLDAKKNHSEMTEENLFLNLVLHDMTSTTVSPQITLETPKNQADFKGYTPMSPPLINYDQTILKTPTNKTDCKGHTPMTPPLINYDQSVLSWNNKNGISSEKAFSYVEVGPEEGIGISDQDLLQELKFKERLSTANKEKSNTTPCSSQRSMQITVPNSKQSDVEVLFFKNQENAKTERAATITSSSNENEEYVDDLCSAYFTTEESILNLDGILSEDKNSLKKRVDVVNVSNTTTTSTVTTSRLLLDTIIPTPTDDSFLNLENSNDVDSGNSCSTTSGPELLNSDTVTKTDFKAHSNTTKLKGLEGAIDMFFATENANTTTGALSTKTLDEGLSSNDDNVIADFENMMLITFPPDQGLMGFAKLPLRTQCDNTTTDFGINLGSKSTESTTTIPSTSSTTHKANTLKYSTNAPEVTTIGTRKTIPPVILKPIGKQLLETTVADRTSRIPSIADLLLYGDGDEDYEQTRTTQRKATQSVTLDNEDDEEVRLATTQNSAFEILSEFINNVRVPKEVTNFIEDAKRSAGTESTTAQCIACGEEYTAGEDLDDEHSVTWMTTRYVPRINGTTFKNPSTPTLSGKTKKFVQNIVIKTNSTEDLSNATKLVNLIALSGCCANQSLTEGPNTPTNINIIENVFYVQIATTEAPAFKTDTQITREVSEPLLLTLPTESGTPPKCAEICTKPSRTTETTTPIYNKFYTSLPIEDEDMGDKIVLHNEAIASSTGTVEKALTGIVIPTSYSLWNVDDFKDVTEPTTIKTTVNTEIVEATLPTSTESKPTFSERTTTIKVTVKTSEIPKTTPTTSPITSKATEPTTTTEKETPTTTSSTTSTTLETTASVPVTLKPTTTTATESSTTYGTTTGFEYFSTLTEAFSTSAGNSQEPSAETTPDDENYERLTISSTTPEEKTTTLRSTKETTEISSTSPEVSTTTQVPSSTAYETTSTTTESTTFLEQTTNTPESTEIPVTETTSTTLTQIQTTETAPTSTDLTVLTLTELETTTFQEQTSTPIESVASTEETPTSSISSTEAETTTTEQTTETATPSTVLTSPTVLTSIELETVTSSEETSTSAVTSTEAETTTAEQTTETTTPMELVTSTEQTTETTTSKQTTETTTQQEQQTVISTEETLSSVTSTELETSTEKQTVETLPSSTMSIEQTDTTVTPTSTTSVETSSVTTETSSVATSELTTEKQTTETSTSTSLETTPQVETTTSITTTTTSSTTTQQQTKSLSTSTFSSSRKTATTLGSTSRTTQIKTTTTHKTTTPSTQESTPLHKPLLVIKETTVSHLGKISVALTTEAGFAKTTVTDKFREIISQMSKESTCNLTDYINRSSCVCSIDNLVVDLREKLKDSDSIDFENYYCPVLKHIDNGITFENNSVPHVIRFVNPGDFQRSKRDVIQNYNIEKVLNEPLELRNKGHDVYAIPGMSMQIPCVHYPEIVESIVNYSWTFADKMLLTEGRVQDHKGILTVDNITPQDGGNYTCFVITSKDQEEANIRYEHYVNIVSLPTYSLVTRILYNSTQQCQSEDTEIISLYFPSSLGVYICGSYFKVCKINVTEPQCVSKMYNYISLNVSVIIEPFNVIVPGINTSICDVNCEMAAYSKIVSFVLKNLETIENMPVFINLSYRQEILFPTNEAYNQTEIISTAEPPKLIIGCPPGFGYYSKTHLCGACKRNTYSKGDETKCQPCPAGQFQPLAGSQSCLICANPLQDPYCLRIVYSNTQRFRLLVGATMIIIIAISILIIWCQCFKKNDPEQSQKNGVRKRKRSKITDIEKQEAQPLLPKEKKRRDAAVSPPEPPPPDF